MLKRLPGSKLSMGKSIKGRVSVDLPLSTNCIRRYAEAIDKIYDEIAPIAPTAISLMRREPLGVVAAVIPLELSRADGSVEERAYPRVRQDFHVAAGNKYGSTCSSFRSVDLSAAEWHYVSPAVAV